MKIAVIYDGPDDVALAATSLSRGLHRKFGQHPITWIANHRNLVFFRQLPGSQVRRLTLNIDDNFDVVVGLGGTPLAVNAAESINSDLKLGICGRVETANPIIAQECARVLYAGERTTRNIFQVLYSLADIRWKGEGYGFKYYPRSRQKANRTGIAVQDDTARELLSSHLSRYNQRLWKIPIREDPLKQFDEINRCQNIITDNSFVMHAATSLRKHVEFLLYQPPGIKPEFFGRGAIHVVPDHIFCKNNT